MPDRAQSQPAESRDGPARWTVRDLRRRWKPIKESLVSQSRCEDLRIRIHRACSWMARAEELPSGDAIDAELLFRWIALNSLYGRWDPGRGEARPDRQCLRQFVSAILKLDEDDRIGDVLEAQRTLVLSIVQDEYLSVAFWAQPSDESARDARKVKFDAERWYKERRVKPIFENAIFRTYTMRCQLVHRAATFRSNVNLSALTRCNDLLGELLPAILLVIIDHGQSADWTGLCYPPLQPEKGS